MRREPITCHCMQEREGVRLRVVALGRGALPCLKIEVWGRPANC